MNAHFSGGERFPLGLFAGFALAFTLTVTALAAPVSMRISDIGCIDAGGTVTVPIVLSNESPVSGLFFRLQDLPDELSLDSGEMVCETTPRTDGFMCAVNEVAGSNRINVLIVSLQGHLVAAGNDPIALLHLRDGGTSCGPGEVIALNLIDIMVTDPDNQTLPVTIADGQVTCKEARSACTTTSTTTSTTTTSTTSTTTTTTTTTSSTTTTSTPTTTSTSTSTTSTTTTTTTTATTTSPTSTTTTSTTISTITTTTRPPRVSENCSDGIDNDGDGLIDCSDPDCQTSPGCSLGCPVGPRLDAVGCRTRALPAPLGVGTPTGKLHDRLLHLAARVNSLQALASSSCQAGKTRRAKAALLAEGDAVVRLRLRLHSLPGGSDPGAGLRDQLRAALQLLNRDLHALRRALRCPVAGG